MNSTVISSPISSSPSSVSRRLCSSTKMQGPASKTHTRSPRSRYSLTYADWITRALMAAKEKCACLSDIYEWMSFNVPGLQEQRFLHSSKGWKNAVRHTLSINPRFQKLKRLGKPALWTLSEEYLRQAQALTKISMSIGGAGAGPVSTVDSAIDSIGQSIIRRSSITAGSSPPARPTMIDTAAGDLAVKSESSVAAPANIPFPNTAHLIGLQQRHNFLADTYRPNFLNNDPYHHLQQQQAAGRNPSAFPSSGVASSSTSSTSSVGGNPLGDLATRAAFLSDVSALASLNALIGSAAGACPETRAATPPLVNFFNGPFSSVGGIGRRGSGDSGISIASTGSASGPSTNQQMVVDSLRPFTQTLDVTTLSGLEATLLFPRPLPIQCLTDHKLLLASLIWPNPAAAAYLTN